MKQNNKDFVNITGTIIAVTYIIVSAVAEFALSLSGLFEDWYTLTVMAQLIGVLASLTLLHYSIKGWIREIREPSKKSTDTKRLNVTIPVLLLGFIGIYVVLLTLFNLVCFIILQLNKDLVPSTEYLITLPFFWSIIACIILINRSLKAEIDDQKAP